MRKLYNNGYMAPKAEITVFECEDVITRSLIKAPENTAGQPKSYVRVGGIDWKDNFGQSE